MQLLTPEMFNEFLDRFYGFCDTVIRSVTLEYDASGQRMIAIRVHARDSTRELEDDWIEVTIEMQAVAECFFHETERSTLQVISNGIHLTHVPEGIALEFGGQYDSPNSVSDLHKSPAFAVGRSVSFAVKSI